MSKNPENWVGYAGAYIADTIIYPLGLVGVWVPMLLARFGMLALVGERILKPGRIIVWLSVFLSQSVLFQWVIGSQELKIYGHSSSINMGGQLGVLVGVELSRWLGETGSAVVIPIWVLLSLMFLWQISLKGIFSGVLRKAVSPATALWERWKVGRERQKLAIEREEARSQVRQKQAERIQIEEQRKSATPVKLHTPPSLAPSLPLEPVAGAGGYIIPPANLLDPPKTRPPVDEQQLMEIARLIERRLQEFEIQGEVVEIHPGPVVTIFEYHPAPGIKYNKVVNCADDLALTLKTEHVRMDRVGGKANIGIEVPNPQREIISYREIVESPVFKNTPGRLPLALGKGVDGEPFVSTLDQMPHLLVAGTTGSGKSVGINVLIHSILFRSSPDEVKFILIDPKHVELKVYEGIPHLMIPVVTDLKKAANALNWAVKEMGERYKMLAACKVRTIDQFNQYLSQSHAHTPVPQEQELAGVKLKPLPYIVIVIDELYDLMAAMAKEVETAIARLSSMARAVGIHLIIATQRPSRDVITGVIKSNLPARVAYQVREKLESRLILDQNGAETLQGKGDMLFLPPGTGRVTRVHGAFISNTETQKVLQYISKQGKPVYDEEVLKEQPVDKSADGSQPSGSDDLSDPLYSEAVRLVVRSGVASASNLQRKMRIGYARAARLLDIMEKNGVVGPADGAKPREIFVEPGEVEDL